MGKRDKNLPNAPEFEQPLFQQPPTNPYYPILSSQYVQPPPYSDLSAPTQAVPMTQINYPTVHSLDYPRQSSVVIHQVPHVPVPYDRRAAKYQRKIKSFNSQTFVLSVVAGILAYVSYSLYKDRPCIYSFTVVKHENIEIDVAQVRDSHLTVLYYSAVIAFLCLIKCLAGDSKSHSCYLFIMGLATFAATLFSGYLAYLTFYSPCTTSLQELAKNALKTISGVMSDSLPNPQQQFFGESNVLQFAKEDRNGLLIFLFDLANFVFYFSIFIATTCMC